MNKSPLHALALPDALTYCSLACVVLSVYLSLIGNVPWGALLWCASAILDNVDGKFASLFKRTAQA
ncbi:MAG TPA: CDP-alcohol phosphatidyltransferase family protein, partial [Candidatus Acidoferrum sp.]|nr:CDP-alcohol phosphatidyltransferase family protein [Candidatus Acidoferrum sp.]